MTDPELNELSQEVFRTFARCEYALKAAGFHCGDGDANVNWRNFAVSIEHAFANPHDPVFANAITYILAQPPKKQVVKNGQFQWEAAIPPTNSRADLVLLYVRRVRNNLFHGGKFNGHWFEPQRSGDLLRHSLVILKAAVQASALVNAAYG
jgi:hypothetical protein